MSWITSPAPRYQYSKVRFFEREHGTEFLKFELDQMKRFAHARRLDRAELDGYVSWCVPPYFVLLPATTTPNAYIICRIEDELNYPDLNQFTTVRGSWVIEILRGRPVRVLLVSDACRARPEFGKITPDITQEEFVGILFDKWRNLRDTTERLIAQSLVSSPTLPAERTGGFTLTLANYSKRNALSMFMGDLRRFIPADFVRNKSLSFNVQELGVSCSLPRFGWEDHMSSLENLPGVVDQKLDRTPSGTAECSITLLQRTTGPIDLDLRAVIKSDYPIVLEELAERTRLSHDVSPEVSKFILATRMSAPTISTDVFEQGLDHSRREFSKLAGAYDMASGRTGSEQFLDLGYRGKPLSVNNLALSLGRSQSLDSITHDHIARASSLYMKNLETVFDVQELWGYDRIPAAATITLEERRICMFLEAHGAQTVQEISENMGISMTDAARSAKSLMAKNLLYEPSPGKFLYVG